MKKGVMIFISILALLLLFTNVFAGEYEEIMIEQDMVEYEVYKAKFDLLNNEERLSPTLVKKDNQIIDVFYNQYSCFDGTNYYTFDECINFEKTNTGFIVEFVTGEACYFDYPEDINKKSLLSVDYKVDLGMTSNLSNMKCNVPYEFVGTDELVTEKRFSHYETYWKYDEINLTNYSYKKGVFKDVTYRDYQPIYLINNKYYVDLDPSFFQDGSWEDNQSIFWQTVNNGTDILLVEQTINEEFNATGFNKSFTEFTGGPTGIAWNGSVWAITSISTVFIFDNDWVNLYNRSLGECGVSVTDIDWNGSAWVVIDNQADIMCFLDTNFTAISTSNVSSQITSPQAIAWCDDWLFVTGLDQHIIFRYYPNGTYEGTSYDIDSVVDNPVGITCDDSYYWVSDELIAGWGWVVKFNKDWSSTGVSYRIREDGVDESPEGIEYRADTETYWIISQLNNEKVWEFDSNRTEFFNMGNYTSQIINASELVIWDTITWADFLFNDTNITIQCRTSNDTTTWTSWSINATKGEVCKNETAQYLQYRGWFYSDSSGENSPYLSSVNVSYLCIENWVADTVNYGDCDFVANFRGGILAYTDLKSCSTTFDLPADNGTTVNQTCSYVPTYAAEEGGEVGIDFAMGVAITFVSFAALFALAIIVVWLIHLWIKTFKT